MRVTKRLILRPATSALLEAEIGSLESFASMLGATVPAGWPPGEYDREAQQFFLERLQNATADDAGWYSWYAIYHGTATAAQTLIGAAGFLGPPDHRGIVEIGFSLHPEWRGRGLAVEMVGELVAFAFEHERVQAIIANTKRENLASCNVLKRLGFVDAQSDPARDEMRFILTRASDDAG